jgi:type IV fimbrial biogenesis protein FimT
MQHRSSIRNPGADAGFTIIELLVTMTLAAILIGIAVPSFRGMMANNRVVAQSNDFVGAINFARSQAITTNSTVTLCRATTAAATACAGSLGAWVNWIIRTPAGAVVRRGTVPTYGGSLSVSSNLTSDSVTFGSDGLARSGGTLVNNLNFRVCTTTATTDNIRQVTLGSGSRLSTTKSSGTC